jgi:hypothetical protein
MGAGHRDQFAVVQMRSVYKVGLEESVLRYKCMNFFLNMAYKDMICAWYNA